MKRLKKYLEFIKESLDTDSIWKIDENKIREFLIELEDAEYIIFVNFGFSHGEWGPTDNLDDIYFSEKVLANDPVRPGIQIEIQRSSKTSNVDVTDDFLAALSAIEMECDADGIELSDNGGKLDKNSLLLKGGIFTGVEPDDDYSGTEIEGTLKVFIIISEEVKLNPKQLADFYGWECDEKTEDNIYVHVDLEDMADNILSSSSHWKKTLLGGEEGLWDHYDTSDYYPSTNSLFQYTLDKENANLLIKSMIKEVGGLENFINHIGDECSDEAYDNVKDKSEQEVIDYLLKERYHETIKQLSSNSEIYSDINQTCADYEMSAHLHDNYNELVSEFDDCVNDEFKFTKIKKEVEKSWKSKDADGNEVVKKYTEEETFYRVEFDNNWIEEWDSEDIFKYNLDGIFREYCGNLDKCELKPRFSDYGHVDSKAMNSEIKAILTKYLK
jgi:hypothetical protein